MKFGWTRGPGVKGPLEISGRRLDGKAPEPSRRTSAGDGYAYAPDLVLTPAKAAIDLLRHGPLDRLKACAACPWLFLDLSRNRSRRWCTMSECGAQSKMRRYRARRATAGR